MTTAAVAPGRLRRSFYDEQASRRRHARWWAAFCGVAILVMGLPLTAVLTPLVFGAVAVGVRLVDLVAPVPAGVWAALHHLAGRVPAALDAWVGGAPAGSFGRLDLAAALAVLLVPGVAAMVAVWAGFRRLARDVVPDAVLARLGAREPRAGDLDERQLVDVVEEMAIAAGLPAPRVLLIDQEAPNAALVGSSPERAVLVMTRGVLKRCDRAETQGVAALLVASAANGDPRLTLAVTAIFQAIGFVFTVLDAFMGWSPSAWREMVRALGWMFRSRRSPATAEAVAESLEGRLVPERYDGLIGLASDAVETEPRTRGGRLLNRFPVLRFFLLPLLLVYVIVFLVRAEVQLLRLLVVGPLMAAMLRARRYLADATAVQLSRDPTEVARGLAALAGEGVAPPGGAWLEHLFLAAPERSGAEGKRPGPVASHPKLERRLRRLITLGADPEDPVLAAAAARRPGFRELLRRQGRRGVAEMTLFALVIGPLLLLAAYLLAMVMGMFLVVAAGGSALFAGAVLRLIDWLVL